MRGPPVISVHVSMSVEHMEESMYVSASDLRQLLVSHVGFLCVVELSVNAMLMGKDCVGTSVLSLLGPFCSLQMLLQQTLKC